MEACQQGDLAGVQRDYDPEMGRDLLMCACRHGHLAIVTWLFEQGVDCRAEDDGALVLACQAGHLAVVEYLCSLGADVHAHLDSPMIYAVNSMRLDLIQFLHTQGADLSLHSYFPFQKACTWGNLELAQWTYANTQEIIPAEVLGHALQISLFGEHVEMIQWLLTLNPPEDVVLASRGTSDEIDDLIYWHLQRSRAKNAPQ